MISGNLPLVFGDQELAAFNGSFDDAERNYCKGNSRGVFGVLCPPSFEQAAPLRLARTRKESGRQG